MLTARGTETRRPGGSAGLSAGAAIGGLAGLVDVDDERFRFAERVMRHVGRVDPDFRMALEMEAAGYRTEDIAAYLDCGDRQARSVVDQGLAVVISTMLLRPELRTWGA